MKYDTPLIRPPSEANSLIIQTTLGCAHNKCTFCGTFKSKKFKVRSTKDIKDDIMEARKIYPYVEKLFLADGDSLIVTTGRLLDILKTIREQFPECKRIGTYGSTKAINLKTEDELKQLKENGLGIIYLGLESGNDEILIDINKGVTAQEVILAGQKVKRVGIPLSITIISGLGGKTKLQEHAVDTAKVLNEIDPDYLGLLTLLLTEGTPIYEQNKSGQFSLLTPEEVMLETKILLENLQLSNCVFRANHASNYLPLKGDLPKDKPALIKMLDKAVNSSPDIFKQEKYRLL